MRTVWYAAALNISLVPDTNLGLGMKSKGERDWIDDGSIMEFIRTLSIKSYSRDMWVVIQYNKKN